MVKKEIKMTTSKKKYVLVSVTAEAWDIIMEAASYDAIYDEETKKAIWNAIGETKYLSDPWIGIEIKNDIPLKAVLFNNQESASKFSQNKKGQLSKKSQVFFLKLDTKTHRKDLDKLRIGQDY